MKSKLCKQRVLCRTLAGNLVYTLTITSPYKEASEAKVLQAMHVVVGAAFPVSYDKNIHVSDFCLGANVRFSAICRYKISFVSCYL